MPVVERAKKYAESMGLAHPQILNVGPQHPAMHGTFRLQVAVDGEKIIDADTEIGYLHRCLEKMSETHMFQTPRCRKRGKYLDAPTGA